MDEFKNSFVFRMIVWTILLVPAYVLLVVVATVWMPVLVAVITVAYLFSLGWVFSNQSRVVLALSSIIFGVTFVIVIPWVVSLVSGGKNHLTFSGCVFLFLSAVVLGLVQYLAQRNEFVSNVVRSRIEQNTGCRGDEEEKK